LPERGQEGLGSKPCVRGKELTAKTRLYNGGYNGHSGLALKQRRVVRRGIKGGTSVGQRGKKKIAHPGGIGIATKTDRNFERIKKE